jgi:hypothetical protein
MATATGTEVPVVKSVLVENVGVDESVVVVLIKTDIVLSVAFTTIMSGLPSPFTSAWVISAVPAPEGKSVLAEKLIVWANISRALKKQIITRTGRIFFTMVSICIYIIGGRGNIIIIDKKLPIDGQPLIYRAFFEAANFI